MRRGLRPAVAPSGLSSASARCAHPPEKALYCPFLKEGVRNVARNIVGEITLTFVRARAHSFPLSKRARLFPSAAYRRSAPPQLALGRLKWRRLGCFGEAWMASQRKRPKGFPNHVSLWREPEGLSPDGGLRSTTNRKLNQTREPRGLSPSGGNSAAKLLSLEWPRAHGRGVGCRGSSPAASREACRRAEALGTKAPETRGLPPSVSRAPYLSA